MISSTGLGSTSKELPILTTVPTSLVQCHFAGKLRQQTATRNILIRNNSAFCRGVTATNAVELRSAVLKDEVERILFPAELTVRR